jgi:hypothetical protein
MALGLFLGFAPAGLVAQTQTYESETQQQTTEPAVPEAETQQQMTEPAVPEAETQQQTTEPAVPEAETQQQTTEPAVPEAETQPGVATTDVGEPTGDVIPVQEPEAMLASSLMGASVNLADESIGKVSDLIIGPDYTLQGVLVGVGGFLGIGEKRVALPMDRITIERPDLGEVSITANTTREELEEQEAFKTASEIRAEQEAEQAQKELEMQQQQQQTQQPQQ